MGRSCPLSFNCKFKEKQNWFFLFSKMHFSSEAERKEYLWCRVEANIMHTCNDYVYITIIQYIWYICNIWCGLNIFANTADGTGEPRKAMIPNNIFHGSSKERFRDRYKKKKRKRHNTPSDTNRNLCLGNYVHIFERLYLEHVQNEKIKAKVSLEVCCNVI